MAHSRPEHPVEKEAVDEMDFPDRDEHFDDQQHRDPVCQSSDDEEHTADQLKARDEDRQRKRWDQMNGSQEGRRAGDPRTAADTEQFLQARSNERLRQDPGEESADRMPQRKPRGSFNGTAYRMSVLSAALDGHNLNEPHRVSADRLGWSRPDFKADAYSRDVYAVVPGLHTRLRSREHVRIAPSLSDVADVARPHCAVGQHRFRR